MRRTLLALALLLPAAAYSQSAPAPATTPVDSRALVIEVTIPAPLPEVWKAFTTADGLQTWLAPNCTVDLKPGGDWLVHFGPSTGGGTIVSFVPQKEIVLSALAPDKFPTVRATRTHAVYSFRAEGNQTVVRLTQTGWHTGPEWDAAYEYLTQGNSQLMAALHKRFVNGPTDWSKM